MLLIINKLNGSEKYLYELGLRISNRELKKTYDKKFLSFGIHENLK